MVGCVLGNLFVGCAGLPLLDKTCDSGICKGKQAPEITMEYRFSLWFLAEFCTMYCVCTGYMEGLKVLFARGLASLQDVSDSRGFSILRVSWKQSAILARIPNYC